MRPIAFLLLCACAARAQDSLVERFEAEMRALVANVDAAAGEALVSIGTGTTYRLDPALRNAKWHLVVDALGVAQSQPAGSAILVGAPARVVAPYSAVGEAERVRVRLGDGREVQAARWGGDPDLGIVVFKLPDDVASGLKGVDVEGDWSRLGAGSVAVATDGRGRGGGKVGLVAAAEPRLGTIDAPGDGAAVFGSRGTLLGLRGGSDMTSCAVCHQTAAWADERGRAVDTRSLHSRALYEFFAMKAQGSQAKPPALNELVGKMVAYDRKGDPHGLRAVPQGSDHLVAGPVIRRVLDDLEQHGAIRHSFLGVVVGDVAGEAAVQIASVVPDSPAAAAGLAPGQKIEAIDGLVCPSAALFSRVLALHRPGDEVTLRAGGREIILNLGERSAARGSFANAETVGLACVELSPDLRRFLGYPEDLRGVVVREVRPKSPAAEAGFRRGDVITGGDGGAIADLEELNAALAGVRGTMSVQGLRITEDGRWDGLRWTVAVPEPQGR